MLLEIGPQPLPESVRRKVQPTSCAMVRDTANNIRRRKAHKIFLNGQDSQLHCLPPLGTRRRAAPLAIVIAAIVVVAVAAVVWSTRPRGDFCSRARKRIPPWPRGSPQRPQTRKRQWRQPRRRQRRRWRSAESLQGGRPKGTPHMYTTLAYICNTSLRSQNAEQLRENGWLCRNWTHRGG